MADRKTALILTGGGARGIFQAGALRAWIKLGLQYDVLYGTSIGTLNGGMLHQAMSADRIEDFWLTISNKKVRKFKPWLALTAQGCFYDPTPFHQMIIDNAEPDVVRANPRPFIINTTNLDSWEPRAFSVSTLLDNDQLFRVVFASTAMPIAFPPVQIDDHLYGDGGLTNNFCIDQAVSEGATRLIIITPEIKEPRPIRSIYDTLQIVSKLPVDAELENTLRYVKCWRPDLEIILIRPDKIMNHAKLLNFNMSLAEKRYWLDEGYNIAMRELVRLTNINASTEY